MTQQNERFLAAKRRLFNKAYSAFLNPEQRRAVFTVNGPVLVLAGAGSGKTTVLVNRITHILKYGNAYFSDRVPAGVSEGMVSALEAAHDEMTPEELRELLSEFTEDPPAPWSILAITFTNKAANEIKARLSKALASPSVAENIWAGTFHSICVRILRRFGDRIGYRDGFSIYDTDDKKRLVTMCMKELSIDEKRLAPRAVCNEISIAKDKLLSPEDYRRESTDVRAIDIFRIYKLYQQKLISYNAVDFDDIIMKTVELLNTDAEVREYYQQKFKYVLVDEYQDTNYAQFVLTSILSDGSKNIMVVGDDDQSIYSFRGATVENILDFDKVYPNAAVIKLEQNYRSTETILSAANAVIQNNGDRHDKRLWCDKGEGDKITLHECIDQHDEGRYIIGEINRAVLSGKRRYSDFAVLYRVNELARSLETSFAKGGVPHRIIGSMRFYDRKEIKDMLAYLSVINSPSDNLRLKRIINEPKRKIGDATVSEIEGIADREGCSMYEVMARAADYLELSKTAIRLSDFVHFLEKIKAETSIPSEIIQAVFEKSGYEAMLVAEGFEGEGKKNNINELVSAALEYERRCSDADCEPMLSEFLEEISLISDVDKYDERADAVVLMTIHAAKGLEFPVVILAGMEDGIFPAKRNLGEEEEMSEERRLAYVAITRAKEKLYVTYAKNRQMYGRTTYGMLSAFIREEVPRDLVHTDRPVSRDFSSERRSSAQFGNGSRGYGAGQSYRRPFNSEMTRPSEISRNAPKANSNKGFGVQKIAVGARVRHNMFGFGVIISAKDLGGDVIYEIKFDNGETKRLMATFAKLERV